MTNTTLALCEKCGNPTLTKPVATKYYCQRCGRFQNFPQCTCDKAPYSMTVIVLHRCTNCQHIQPIWSDYNDLRIVAGGEKS